MPLKVMLSSPVENHPRAKGLDEEVNRVATDSANLVSAYKELNNCRHQNELPSTIDQVQQHIAELKTIIPRSDETQS